MCHIPFREVSHLHNFVLQSRCGRKSSVLIHAQHLLEDIDELASVQLLAHHVDVVQIGGNVHLKGNGLCLLR